MFHNSCLAYFYEGPTAWTLPWNRQVWRCLFLCWSIWYIWDKSPCSGEAGVRTPTDTSYYLKTDRQTCNQMWYTHCNKIQMYWSDVTSCPVTVSVNYAHYCFLCTHNYSHMARPSVQSLLYKRLTVLHMKQKHSFMKKASSRFSSFCLINKKTKQKCYPVTFL